MGCVPLTILCGTIMILILGLILSFHWEYRQNRDSGTHSTGQHSNTQGKAEDSSSD
jgi:heme/copper-type cytochrome/quinol oxidase subunit 2